MAVETILALLAVMLILVAIAHKLGIPEPILLVTGGLAISLVPGLPRVTLEPDIVFVLFLPPIIQLSAYDTSMRDFRTNLRSIGLMAIGLVLASMIAVAVIAHMLIPSLPWPAAFVLGAIVAPPDAVAASSIAKRFRLPRIIVTVLEGESLLNDATSLVAYRTAVVAVVTGAFSMWQAGGEFLLSSLGGIAIGIAGGFVVTPFFRRLANDVPVYLTFTFLSGFAVYLLADALHASGVLAVIALGLFYAQPRFSTMTPVLRIQGTAIWEMVVFLLNGMIFILIGLQLRGVVERLAEAHISLISAVVYAIVVCFVLAAVRMIWVFPGAYLGRIGGKVQREVPPWQHILIVGWTGMRGIVSLASALALPLVIEGGAPFPQRDLIIFITFVIILVTIIGQGLSLPLLIRWLKITTDGSEEREKHKARLKVALSAQTRLHELVEQELITKEFALKMKKRYASRVQLHTARYHGERDEEAEVHSTKVAQLEQDLLEVELDALVRLRNEEWISDEVMRRVQQELDFEWLRLEGEQDRGA
ncbi:Na+/H+ antiporter [Ktedonospora formicarum]|uniref:Na+/H+ antiporter n=1 Tax=Ktedonospora formicarum TaxID=2778364 RepID=A0A8J3I7K0_9CHLR|nr:Na+/H+ antiporter [Ktedonospora formicarum]GHO46864.1 Na+/H+ antiporter [Ktedonospora formicarum]